MTSQTASNVSALVSLQQNALQENLGSSLSVTELTGNSLTGSGLTGNGLVGTSLGNSLTTSLPVNNLTGSSLHSTSLSGEIAGSSLTGTSLSGNSLSGNSISGDGSTLTGTSVSGSGLTGSYTSQTGTNLVPGSQTGSTSAGSIPTLSVSQNAMLQQRAKPQRSKLPPPSKVRKSFKIMNSHWKPVFPKWLKSRGLRHKENHIKIHRWGGEPVTMGVKYLFHRSFVGLWKSYERCLENWQLFESLFYTSWIRKYCTLFMYIHQANFQVYMLTKAGRWDSLKQVCLLNEKKWYQLIYICKFKDTNESSASRHWICSKHFSKMKPYVLQRWQFLN